jgi:5'-3' exonuclease
MKYGLDECWMVSSDKDWDLLINDRVSRFSTVTRKETTVHNWDEHYDFEIPDYITFKCLTGDKGRQCSRNTWNWSESAQFS